MRSAAGLFVFLCWGLLIVQPAMAEVSPEAAVARRLDRAAVHDLEFDAEIVEVRLEKRHAAIILRLTVDVRQLQFDDEGDEVAARFAVMSVDGDRNIRMLKDAQRVFAPAGTLPMGEAHAQVVAVTSPRATELMIALVDRATGAVGFRTIVFDGKSAHVEPMKSEASDADVWRESLARARAEKKPALVFFRPRPCGRCREFERVTLPHPAIQRRLNNVVLVTLSPKESVAAATWASQDAGFAYFDHAGALRVRWGFVPETTNFGLILDSIVAVEPQFERAVAAAERGEPAEGELHAAAALVRLGMTTEARSALERARTQGSPPTQQRASIVEAVLDATKDTAVARALEQIEDVLAHASDSQVAAEASFAIGKIHRDAHEDEAALRAFKRAAELAPAESPTRAAAEKAVGAYEDAANDEDGAAIRILALPQQIVTGRFTVKTHVSLASVARVAFSLDRREIVSVARPPFSAILNFGDIPERHTVGVIAFDRRGREVGRAERVVNDGGETFWLRLVSPREGPASGSVRVVMEVRVPVARSVRRVVVSWNDVVRATLTHEPWATAIAVPAQQVGVLRAVAELEDGRTSEDAVLLNAGGAAGQSTVQLVELPITVVGRDNDVSAIRADDIVVREGKRVRRVQSIAKADETPLTVGLLIDVSDSMHRTLLDVQEAAIRFLETTLGARDRAFLVTFDSSARLVQPATADVALLRRRILGIRAEGLTSLHDAMVLGLLQFEGIKGRRAMVLFSDGGDRTSQYREEDVMELAKRVNVPIHVIASLQSTPARLDEDALPAYGGMPKREWEAATGGLKRVALATGGSMQILENLAELPKVYSQIEAALRSQILVFVGTDPATRDNEWRPIDVTIPRKPIQLFAPAGFYASW